MLLFPGLAVPISMFKSYQVKEKKFNLALTVMEIKKSKTF